jgi:type I restriction enzyme S subunit
LQLFLSSDSGQKLIDQAQSGSGRAGLNFQSIRKFSIPFPSQPEQTKIANFLTALDRKIESVAQQIELIQSFNRGLLQQMFV